jgi:hypothetical protein
MFLFFFVFPFFRAFVIGFFQPSFLERSKSAPRIHLREIVSSAASLAMVS